MIVARALELWHKQKDRRAVRIACQEDPKLFGELKRCLPENDITTLAERIEGHGGFKQKQITLF